MSRKKSRSSKTDITVERASKRAAQSIRKQQQTMSSYLSEDVNYGSFSNNLALHGLKLRDIPGDGNCLFRALGDQLDGNSENHLHHREETVKYMIAHRNDFEPFVEDDVPFSRHVDNLRNPGTYAGNDAIVAFARNHGVNIVIHQLNAPVWTVKGSEQTNSRQFHIAYHNGDHYSSIRKINDNSSGPANVKLTSKTDFQEPENTSHRRGGKRRPESASDHELQKIKRISSNTGCKDLKLIKKYLLETGYDENETVGLLLQNCISDEEEVTSTPAQDRDSNINHRTSNNPIWDRDGTGSRIFGPQNNAPKRNKTPNGVPKKLSNKKRQQEARRERANRNTGRRRNTPTSDSDESEIVVKNLSMLNI